MTDFVRNPWYEAMKSHNVSFSTDPLPVHYFTLYSPDPQKKKQTNQTDQSSMTMISSEILGLKR
jgi:hypothetical protein